MAAFSFQPPKEKELTSIEVLKDNSQNIADPAQRQTAQNQAKNKTLKTLNAIKIVSPILEALIINPGKEGDVSENFKSLVSTTSALSAEICQKLEINPEEEKNYWIRNSFERVFAEIIKQQWITHNHCELKEIQAFLDAIIENSNLVESEFQSLGISIDNDIKMSLVRSTIPLISEIKSGFDLNRNLHDDLDGIMTLIFETAKEGLTKIVDENADSKQKANLLKMLIQEATNLYKASWKSYGLFTQNYLSNAPENKKKQLKEKYAKGFPLTQLEAEFKTNFDRLILITQRIIPNQVGNIEKRVYGV